MTREEFNKILDKILPPTVGGMVRPSEPIPTDLDFCTEFRQFLQADVDLANHENAFLRQLFSNDKQCQIWINELIDALDKQDFNLATQKIKGLMSAADKAKVDGMQAGAEVNQNAFSNLKAGAQTVAATTKTDTLELAAGSNIALTASGKKITVAVSGIANGAEVNQNAFSAVQVGTAKINAAAKTDTITMAAGKNISIIPDAANKKITIQAEDSSGENVGHIGFTISNIPDGCLVLDTGAVVSRVTYPELWTFVQSNRNLLPVVSEAQWAEMAENQTSVAAFSTGDGSTTFRLPKLLDYSRGGTVADVGTWYEDAIRNITGTVGTDTGWIFVPGSTTGAFAVAFNKQIISNNVMPNAGNGTYPGFRFDASKQVPTATENRPKTITGVYYIRAFHGTTNEGLADITVLANEKADRDLSNISDTGKQTILNNVISSGGGYIKFADGTMIQTLSSSPNSIPPSSGRAYYFPISFVNAAHTSTITFADQSSNRTGTYVLQLRDLYQSGVYIYNPNPTYCDFVLTSIGRWK